MKSIDVWFDSVGEPDRPRWVVSLENGSSKTLKLFRAKAAALKYGRSQARKRGLPLRVMDQYGNQTNPARRRVTKRKATRKNAASKSRSLSLRNFTGKVRLNPDKTVSILGVGKRKKKATAKRGKR